MFFVTYIAHQYIDTYTGVLIGLYRTGRLNANCSIVLEYFALNVLTLL